MWGPPHRAAGGSPAPVASGVPRRGAQGLSRSRRVSGSRRPQRDQKPVGGWPLGKPGRLGRSGSPRFSGEGADAAAGGGGPGVACAPGLPQPDVEPAQSRTEALRSRAAAPRLGSGGPWAGGLEGRGGTWREREPGTPAHHLLARACPSQSSHLAIRDYCFQRRPSAPWWKAGVRGRLRRGGNGNQDRGVRWSCQAGGCMDALGRTQAAPRKGP